MPAASVFAGKGGRGAAAAGGGRSVDGRLAAGSGGGTSEEAVVSRGAGDEPVRAEERGWG